MCFRSLAAPQIGTLWLAVAGAVFAQEESVRPGINDAFAKPNVGNYVERFEMESREIFAHRHAIVAACKIQPGDSVADIGAGTGLFTRLFSDAVGPDGRVIAVDIAREFLEHIEQESGREGRRNISTQLGTDDSTGLAPDSIDVAFICDTYHHFEFPFKTMASIHRALRPGGRVIVIDFHRIPGTSREWILGHVRAGQEVFEAEIIQSGFRKTREERELLEENYFVVFEKLPAAATAPADVDVQPSPR